MWEKEKIELFLQDKKTIDWIREFVLNNPEHTFSKNCGMVCPYFKCVQCPVRFKCYTERV